MVVFDDADPEAVAAGIRLAGYWNSGQDCTAGSRVIAGPKIYDRLLEALVPQVESLKVGDPLESDEIEMGSVISQAQQERILGFLERAKGATVLTGGGTNGDSGFFVKPTVVTDVKQTDEIVQDEVFGPVVTVQRFADDDGGDRLGERRPLRPRRLGVDARRRPRDERGAQASQFGCVWVNDHLCRSRRRCRTAATSSPATARTCRCTRWRSTRRSSTPPSRSTDGRRGAPLGRAPPDVTA